MKRLLLFLFIVCSVSASAQIVNNTPWYEYSKKLGVGKLQMKRAGEYSTSFTIPNITASVALDTITEDRTVTFPDLAMVDTSVIIYVFNSNSSAFVWNVIGNVRESETGDVIESISRGLHVFIWTGSYWARQKTGGGSTPATDTNTVIYPITMVNRAIGIDPDGLPVDTCFVAVHNDSLFNVCYYYTGVRDSTFVSMIGGSVTAANGLRMDGDTVKLANEIAGTTLTENVELEGHTNLVNIRLLAQELTFDPKVKTLFQANTNDSAIVEMKQMYKTHLDSVGDFDATLGKSYAGATLGQITANRTIDLQSLALDKRGVSFRILNLNNSAFSWNVSQASSTIVDEDGSLVTEIADRITDFVWDGVKWVKKSGGGGGSGSLYVGNSGNSGERLLWSSPGSPDTLYGKRLIAGSNITLTNNADSTITIASAGGSNAWVYGGNTVGADSSIGTLDNFSLLFKTNGVVRSRILNNGIMLFNKSSGTATGTWRHQFGDSTVFYKQVFVDETGIGTGGNDGALVVRGKSTGSTDYALNVVNSAGTILLRLTNAGGWASTGASIWSASALRFPTANYVIQAGNSATTTGNFIFFQGATASTHTSGAAEIVVSKGNHQPSSGTGSMVAFKAQTAVSQTGTASGDVIGFENAPGLTALLGRNIAFKATTGETILKSVITALVNKTTAYTADATDHTITCDATSAAFTVTLPAASGITGRTYVIKKTDASANAVTVDGNASETIDGATTYSLAAQWKYVVIQSNGTNWVIIGNN